MSNPTIATKLITLVKGIFGRNEPTAPTGSADAATSSGTAVEKAQEQDAVATPAAADAKTGAKTDAKTGAEPAADTVTAEPAAAPKAAATVTEEKKPEAVETETVETAVEEKTVEEKAPETVETAVEEPVATEKSEAQVRTEPVVPATADVPEEAPAIAEELAAAEAHTTVASDEVLEKVRKGAAPAVEDLAVPTYDELTLPSVRARLRKLTIEQVRDLRAYEVAHGGRTEFIKMYDNRIAKMEAEA
ncbi:hypothetical protein Q8791_11535 [Nocardiopsis sp. CT-R113]|uniref:DUF8129 domain-containing protein n=1 Tax=Nocardiopsis codii TaxID=3065942 RepID=A0ABU7K6I1_9ACTN|nr:hypothetical protein [Nocardiopsis sp. CT-R113]MEE2037851.1 hypothetical protein [Nocardiopsis sp. CT-R113]